MTAEVKQHLLTCAQSFGLFESSDTWETVVETVSTVDFAEARPFYDNWPAFVCGELQPIWSELTPESQVMAYCLAAHWNRLLVERHVD